MPPRYAFRLEDLRVFHLVRASCHACGHKDVVPNAALLQGRPGYTRLMSLERLCVQARYQGPDPTFVSPDAK